MDCKPGELMPGTVLATFNAQGRYYNMHGFHTVLCAGLTHDRNGRPHTLTVIHQYRKIGKFIGRETFYFRPNAEHYKDARNYYAVEGPHGASASW